MFERQHIVKEIFSLFKPCYCTDQLCFLVYGSKLFLCLCLNNMIALMKLNTEITQDNFVPRQLDFGIKILKIYRFPSLKNSGFNYYKPFYLYVLGGFLLFYGGQRYPLDAIIFASMRNLYVLLVSGGMKTHLQELLDFLHYLKRQTKHLFCQTFKLPGYSEMLLKNFQRM